MTLGRYEHISSQKSRLGSFELGQWGGSDLVGTINAIGNAVNGVVNSITTSKVLRTQSKDRRIIATTLATENTKRLDISETGATERAKIGVEQAATTYGGIFKIVVGAGAVLALIIIAGGFAYKAAVGDAEYEVTYE